MRRLVLLSVWFIYPMSGRCSTNWDRQGWHGSEIQTYNGCRWKKRDFLNLIFSLTFLKLTFCIPYFCVALRHWCIHAKPVKNVGTLSNFCINKDQKELFVFEILKGLFTYFNLFVYLNVYIFNFIWSWSNVFSGIKFL